VALAIVKFGKNLREIGRVLFLKQIQAGWASRPS
jgi:hypothetical protein